MINKASKKTKRDGPSSITFLHFMLSLISVMVITILKLLPKSTYLRYLCFTLIDDIKSIDCTDNAFIFGNIFIGISFFL